MAAKPLIPPAFECPGDEGDRYLRFDGQEPGYKLYDGRVVWDDTSGHGAMYRQDVAIYTAPADLTGLAYGDLTGLKYALAGRERRLRQAGRRCGVTETFAKRLWAEIPTRPEYQRAFGGAAVVRAEAA